MDGAPETSHESPRWNQLRTFFREELEPRPGRLKAALARVAGTILALWVGLALNVPELSAVLALAFFASSLDRTECKKIALGVAPAVLVIFLLLVLFLNIFGVTPLVRTVAFIVIIFASLYLLQAAQAGAVFLLAGLFGKLFLSLWDSGYPTQIIQELQLWIIADLAVGGLCALLVCYIFGYAKNDSTAEFRNELSRRFDLLARFLSASTRFSEDNEQTNEEEIRAEALGASDKLLSLLNAAKNKDAAIKLRYSNFAALVRLAVLLLHQSVISKTYSLDDQRKLSQLLNWISVRCAAIAQGVRSGDPVAPPQTVPEPTTDPFALAMTSTVTLAEDVFAGRVSLPEDQKQETSKKFFRPDAFSNPDYLNNAFRATVAAFACYCLVAGSDWSGIGTSITTCLITALTTVEQAHQKQSLRLLGAALGGIIGLLVIVFVLPAGGGLTSLSVVTAIVTLLGGWIYAGSPRLSYAGVQLVLCFYLGVFGENSTPTSLTGLRDRVVGILIGNIAMWLFYDRIKPVWTADVSRSAFADELLAVGRLAGVRATPQDKSKAMHSLSSERKAFLNASTGLKEMGDARNFEFNFFSKLQRKKAPQIRRTELQLQQLFSFEFVAIETDLLRLSSPEPSTPGLSSSLLTLSSLVREGNDIRIAGPQSSAHDASPDERLVERIRTEFACLFSPDKATV